MINNNQNKIFIYVFLLITLLYFSNMSYTIQKEPFMNKKLKKWLEPRLCYGWFFKIKIPIINIKIKFCIPGLIIPIPLFSGRSGGSDPDGYSGECDGTKVCEI